MKNDNDVSVLRKESKEYLSCKLTPAELKDFSKQLANSYERKQEIDASLDTFRAQAKSRLTEIEGNIGRLSNLVSSEIEYRSVDCEMIYDFKKGKKTLLRKDTGEILRTEDLTNEERQMELPVK